MFFSHAPLFHLSPSYSSKSITTLPHASLFSPSRRGGEWHTALVVKSVELPFVTQPYLTYQQEIRKG